MKLINIWNNLDELNELSEDGLKYSDDDVDFLPDYVSSNEDSDSDSESSVVLQNTIQNIKKSDDDDDKLDRNISVREPFFLNLTFKNNKKISRNILWKIKTSLNEEGDDTLPREIMDLDTPCQFFKYLWTDEIISCIYEESKRYAIQKIPRTINRNRIPNSKIPTEKVFNKMERGHSMEFVGSYNDVKISVTAWKDNKTVIMASTFADEKPLGKHNSSAQNINEKQEMTVHENFFHLLDLVTVNAWLLYKRVETGKKSENKKNLMNLQKFKSKVASCLCKMGYNQSAKRGRSSKISVEQMFKTKRCKRTAQSVPCKDIRRDGINHWPLWSKKRIRCKFPNCKGYTQWHTQG
ncbi:chimeric ERCC6-PGBD3 protein [Trichonephila clavipes]|nr:chimeric ERCC6-PGBD3 protein [Trichonephila clavipes]